MGSIDQPLSAEGRAELLPLAGRCGEPQIVFTSPMRRCIETAEILFPGYEYETVENLRERHFGDFEGKTHDEIIRLPGYEGWGMNEASMDFPGGEDKAAFFARCAGAFRRTADWCLVERIVDCAMIIHGGVIMAVMAEFCMPEPGLPKKGYYDWHCQNGCGYSVEWDGRILRLKEKLEG